MPFDKVIPNDCRVTSGEVRCDLQVSLEPVERVLIDILGLNHKPGLPHVIDPGRAAPAGWRFHDLNDRSRVGLRRRYQCCSRAGHYEHASFQWCFLFLLGSIGVLWDPESRAGACGVSVTAVSLDEFVMSRSCAWRSSRQSVSNCKVTM